MNYAILLAGGTGSRINTEEPKQYIRAGGHMMITYAIRPLVDCSLVDTIYIVAERDRWEPIQNDIRDMGIPGKKISGYAEPGNNRQVSILNGLREILRIVEKVKGSSAFDDGDTVLIHDAARPFLASVLLDMCYRSLPGHDGVMPVLPMKDTVYYSEDGSSVTELMDRSKIFAGQAPELFRLKAYFDANLALLPDKIMQINGASEPAFLAGMDIAMIAGDETNIKITTDSDLKKYIEFYQIQRVHD